MLKKEWVQVALFILVLLTVIALFCLGAWQFAAKPEAAQWRELNNAEWTVTSHADDVELLIIAAEGSGTLTTLRHGENKIQVFAGTKSQYYTTWKSLRKGEAIHLKTGHLVAYQQGTTYGGVSGANLIPKP